MNRPEPVVLVVSPHPDDAALCVGGWMARLAVERPAALRSWHVVNVFTHSTYSPYRPELRDCHEVSAVRRNEDAAFAADMGVRVIELGLVDSSIRGIPDDEEHIAPLAGDARLPEVAARLASIIGQVRPDIVLTPATIGGHIDHRIVLVALRSCHGAWLQVHYEDLPYAGTASLTEALTSVRRVVGCTPVSWTVDFSSVAARKLSVLCHYRSQLSAEEMRIVFDHHGDVLIGRYAERLWTTCTTPRLRALLGRLGVVEAANEHHCLQYGSHAQVRARRTSDGQGQAKVGVREAIHRYPS